MSLFADVIVDISQESLDRPFQYRIPVDLAGRVGPGTAVRIPFGRGDREITGYVIGTGQTPKIAPERIKEIAASWKEVWELRPGSLPWPPGCGIFTVPL